MIKIDNISYQYPNKKKVFSNLSLDLQNGKIYGLLGMNGAGKSTLLYLMSSLIKPQSGQITIDGDNVSSREAKVLEKIFIVPEEYDLPQISLDEYVKINRKFYPNFDEAKLLKMIEAFKLPTEMNIGQLSMGQKKKVYMSFALATGVRLILMDEPTNGMDIPSKIIFRRILRDCISDDSIILISTHQVRDVEELLDSVIFIDNSKILLNKDMDELKKEYIADGEDKLNLESLFNYVIEKTYKEGGLINE